MGGAASGGVTVLGSLHHDIMVDAPTLPQLGETVAGMGWRPVCGGKGPATLCGRSPTTGWLRARGRSP